MKDLLKVSHYEWLAQRAVHEAMTFARQVKRKDGELDLWISFATNEMVSPPIMKPSIIPLSSAFLADMTIVYKDGLPQSVAVRRVITRAEHDAEEKQAREARRAAAV